MGRARATRGHATEGGIGEYAPLHMRAASRPGVMTTRHDIAGRSSIVVTGPDTLPTNHRARWFVLQGTDDFAF